VVFAFRYFKCWGHMLPQPVDLGTRDRLEPNSEGKFRRCMSFNGLSLSCQRCSGLMAHHNNETAGPSH
jgi:hypothetical protein